jgi:hypothetical protein
MKLRMPRNPLKMPIQARSLASGWVWSVWPWLLTLLSFTRLHASFDNDMFFHIRMGNWILQHHNLSGDPSWVYGTTALPWKTTESASEIVMAFLFNHFNWISFSIAKILLGAIFVGIVWHCLTRLAPLTAKNNPGPARVAFIISTAIVLLFIQNIQERPVAVTFVFVPFVAIWLIRMATQGVAPKLWVVVLGIILLTPFHPYTMLVGPLLFVAALSYILGAGKERYKSSFRTILKRVPALLVISIAPVVNPIGIRIYTQALRIRSNATGLIVEWQRPNIKSLMAIMAILFLVYFLVLIFNKLYALWSFGSREAYLAGKVTIMRQVFLLAITFVLLFSTLRSFVLFTILFAFVLANLAMRVYSNTGIKRWEIWPQTRKNTIIAISAVALGVVGVLGWGFTKPGLDGLLPKSVPLKIYQDMAKTTGTHYVFIDYDLSSSPANFVPYAESAIDGRTDAYPYGALKNYLQILNLKGNWKQSIGIYANTTDVVINSQSPLKPELIKYGWILQEESEMDSTGLRYAWLTAGPHGLSFATIARGLN